MRVLNEAVRIQVDSENVSACNKDVSNVLKNFKAESPSMGCKSERIILRTWR